MIALWLMACDPELAPAPPATPELRAELSARSVGSGENATLSVHARAPEGWTVELLAPQPQGLLMAAVPSEGDSLVQRWSVGGADGSYIVPPFQARFTNPSGQVSELESGPLYLDIGVQGPSADLEDLAVFVPEERLLWPWFVGGGLVLLTAGAALLLSRTRASAWINPPPPPPPPIPPDEEALSAWAAARADSALDDHGLALALSALFRRYLERRLEMPALTLTSVEILDRLRSDPRFTAALHERAARLLGATDLIKFARHTGGAVFDTLDQDLREVIAATAPQPEAPEEGGDV